MNVNKDKVYYSTLGAKLSYLDNIDSTENDYDSYSKVAYIKASDSIKAKCGDKEITILDSDGNTNLQRLYLNGSDKFNINLDTLLAIFSTAEEAKEFCRNIAKVIDAESNY